MNINTAKYIKYFTRQLYDVAGIATCYGLDGLEIESWRKRHFPHLPRPPFGPTQPPIQCVPSHSLGKSCRGVAFVTDLIWRRG
jgi:hypothetical protein